MKHLQKIERAVKNFCLMKKSATKTTWELDDKIISDALLAQEKSKKLQSAINQPNLWRIIMKNNASKLAATIIIITVVLSLLVFDKLNTPVWALSETIEAIKEFRDVHLVGAFPAVFRGNKENACKLSHRIAIYLTGLLRTGSPPIRGDRAGEREDVTSERGGWSQFYVERDPSWLQALDAWYSPRCC